jgi:L-alanine-DL-glutamate epimerase-like enolase superfamily enzyme
MTVQRTCIVQLEHQGRIGLGEATVNDFYGATLDAMQSALASVQADIDRLNPMPPEALWAQLNPVLQGCRFAQCALDCAAWDLWGQLQDKPVYQCLGLERPSSPKSCYTIGIDSPDVMVRKLNDMPGWPVYKIKVGTPNDLQVLRLLRKQTQVPFRVDANCGWHVDQVLDLARQLVDLNVELIEQPLPRDQIDRMPELKQKSPVVLMADESCELESDVDRCADGFHAINIKLVKCGGLTPSVRMARRARQLGLKVMVGCMTESSIGISASAQLLPLLDYADLDGAVLLSQDIADGVSIERGEAHFPNRPGLGVRYLLTAQNLAAAV